VDIYREIDIVFDWTGLRKSKV